MTSLTSTNVFTISCLSIEHSPPPGPVNLVLQHWCKAFQSLYCTICRLFVLFVAYSRTIRGLFVLFVDYSRTIRFTILVLSIAAFHSIINEKKDVFVNLTTGAGNHLFITPLPKLFDVIFAFKYLNKL
jgi:hypothetical protein